MTTILEKACVIEGDSGVMSTVKGLWAILEEPGIRGMGSTTAAVIGAVAKDAAYIVHDKKFEFYARNLAEQHGRTGLRILNVNNPATGRGMRQAVVIDHHVVYLAVSEAMSAMRWAQDVARDYVTQREELEVAKKEIAVLREEIVYLGRRLGEVEDLDNS
jgi:hypothetical protein